VNTPAYSAMSGQPARPVVDARSLWAGGVAAALVASLVAIVGVLIAEGLLDVPVVAPSRSDGMFGDANTTHLALSAGMGALAATGLIHLLILLTPRPMAFFGWIVGLVTLTAALWPFATDAARASQLATAAIYLAVGVAIGTLVASVATRAVRRAYAIGPR
jgi:Family of unknown function (DUF6069)